MRKQACPGFFKLGRLLWGSKMYNKDFLQHVRQTPWLCEHVQLVSVWSLGRKNFFQHGGGCDSWGLLLIYPPCCLQYSGIYNHAKFIHSPQQFGSLSLLNHQKHCGINNLNIPPIPALIPPYCSFCLSWLGFHSS